MSAWPASRSDTISAGLPGGASGGSWDRFLEGANDLRKDVARLRMRSGNHHLALFPIGELFAQLPEIRSVEKDTLDDLQDFLARLGQAEQALAVPDEQFKADHPEVLDVLAHAGLRGRQDAGNFGEIEVSPDRLAYDAQAAGGSCG